MVERGCGHVGGLRKVDGSPSENCIGRLARRALLLERGCKRLDRDVRNHRYIWPECPGGDTVLDGLRRIRKYQQAGDSAPRRAADDESQLPPGRARRKAVLPQGVKLRSEACKAHEHHRDQGVG